jgi:hypothetical protein
VEIVRRATRVLQKVSALQLNGSRYQTARTMQVQVLTITAAVDSSTGSVITNTPSVGHGSLNESVILNGVTAPAT